MLYVVFILVIFFVIKVTEEATENGVVEFTDGVQEGRDRGNNWWRSSTQIKENHTCQFSGCLLGWGLRDI